MKKHLILFLMFFSFSIAQALAAEVKLMEKEELNRLLGTKDLVVLDVRAGRDWSASEFKIQGAVRTDDAEFETWSNTFPKGAKLVLYCA